MYGALPTLAVAWLAPAGVGVYALAERLGRYVTMAVTPLHNWMQGWVPAARDSSSINQRIRAAILAAITVGGGAGIALYLLGPVLGRLLGGGTISLDSMLIAGVAVAIAATTVSRCTGGACLIALNDAKSVAISSFVGAGTCVLALGVLVPPMGAIGAAMAMAMAEVTVLLYQIVALLTFLITGRGRTNRQAAMPVMRHARRNAGYYKNK
ncbi:hypothetical protein GCM10007170_06330 [Arthrobacter liuii]|uniref:Polysaccharide biosynthesis protein C-terminal domain-containing protein n=1 Tax=Arthrobacter liuii TaxID=1476996 RepID=A0ABQ2AJE2_9MICC|nr:hypothetical protein GCM10007170_06330 [Arthrobacter liuii]